MQRTEEIMTTEANIIKLDGEDVFMLEDDTAQDDLPEEQHVIPKYSMMFTDFLCVPEYDMETGKLVGSSDSPAPRRAMSCFNCLGDHSVSDCPEPKNFATINKNRRALMSSRPSGSVRYHEMFSNKYGQSAPGKMSSELRHALGLHTHQISETVYRMRLLGYPPGWLMEAREQTGEVLLIGGDGKAVCQPSGEDGELAGGTKYQPEKLIEYPGFNAPLSRGIREECESYQLPYMDREHSLEHWRTIMNRNRVTPYRKRKMRPANTGDIDTVQHIQLDESQDSSSPRSDGTAEAAVARSPEESLEDGEVDSDSATAASNQHKVEAGSNNIAVANNTEIPVIEVLDDSAHPNDTITLDSTGECSMFLDTGPAAPVEEGEVSEPCSPSLPDSKTDTATRLMPSKDSAASTPSVDSNSDSVQFGNGKNKTHRRAKSKGFVLGAVIPDSITHFTALPDADKWTVDVTDHILFENLPDALGTWDNMRGIMKKVRSKISRLHAED